MSLEWWKSFFEIGGVLLLFWTFVFGAGALFTSTRINRLQATQLHNFERELTDAKIELGKQQERAANAERDLEQERIARLKLEATVAWRKISKDKQQSVATKLEPFAGQTAILTYNVGDTEALAFASDIATVLRLAKWNAYSPATVLNLAMTGRHENTVVEVGVLVKSTSDKASRSAANAVVHEISALGFDCKLGSVELNRNTSVFLEIDSRPEGPQGEAKLRGRTSQSHK